MPDLAAAGLDTPAQRVRHGARMAVVPERIPAAGGGLRRSWRCALLDEHWRPSYLAERDPWLCVPASRRVCLFQLGVVPFGQYAHELLPFEGNWTPVRRLPSLAGQPDLGLDRQRGPPRMPRTAGRLLRYPSEHLQTHRPRAWFGRATGVSARPRQASALPWQSRRLPLLDLRCRDSSNPGVSTEQSRSLAFGGKHHSRRECSFPTTTSTIRALFARGLLVEYDRARDDGGLPQGQL
jgi:hypothetical protein